MKILVAVAVAVAAVVAEEAFSEERAPADAVFEATAEKDAVAVVGDGDVAAAYVGVLQRQHIGYIVEENGHV